MPLTDISRVTTAVQTLIRQTIARDNFPDDLDVSAAPPEDETNAAPNVISLYLFHIVEDPHRKNLPPRRHIVAESPIQYTETGLVLNYVITARNTSATGGGDRALIEQRLLGYVVRALHDFPVITDDTVIPAVPPNPPNNPIFQTANLSGADNSIELILRPVGIDETVNFWSNEQERAARLALYYEARVILLSTPPVTSTPGIVYSLGGYVSVSGQPFLQSVQNMVGFIPPPGFAPSDPASPFQFLLSNPARVSLFPAGAIPPDVAPENNRFRIDGSDLRDERTFLALRGSAGVGAAAPVERSFRIDVDDGEQSNLEFRRSRYGAHGGHPPGRPGRPGNGSHAVPGPFFAARDHGAPACGRHHRQAFRAVEQRARVCGDASGCFRGRTGRTSRGASVPPDFVRQLSAR